LVRKTISQSPNPAIDPSLPAQCARNRDVKRLGNENGCNCGGYVENDGIVRLKVDHLTIALSDRNGTLESQDRVPSIRRGISALHRWPDRSRRCFHPRRWIL